MYYIYIYIYIYICFFIILVEGSALVIFSRVRQRHGVQQVSLWSVLFRERLREKDRMERSSKHRKGIVYANMKM